MRPARPSLSLLWRHEKSRAILIQGLFGIALVAIGWLVVATVAGNVAERGLTTGFDFLDRRAGFRVGFSLIPFGEESTFARAFLVGLLNTLLVAVIAIAAATVVGLVVGAARLSKHATVAGLATFYVESVRNVPPLLQLFFWYFVALRALPNPRQSWDALGLVFLNNRGLFVPAPLLETTSWTWVIAALTLAALGGGAWIVRRRARRGPLPGAAAIAVVGLALVAVAAIAVVSMWSVPALEGFNFAGGFVLTPELTALALALSIYQAAYVAETVRAGIKGVAHGQHEAAAALGLRPVTALGLVVIPQAVRISLPPLATIYVNTLKGSTLAAAIAYPDLVSVFAGTVLNLTGQAIEIMLVTGAVYLSISAGVAGLLALYNAYLHRRYGL